VHHGSMLVWLLYLGLCRILGLPTLGADDVELAVVRHEVRVLERQVHGRGGTAGRPGAARETAAYGVCTPRHTTQGSPCNPEQAPIRAPHKHRFWGRSATSA
jgi:hypothetical protein